MDLVQGEARLPNFLCLVTGKADLPLVLHSTHQKLFLFNRVHHSATLLSQDSCALGYLKTIIAVNNLDTAACAMHCVKTYGILFWSIVQRPKSLILDGALQGSSCNLFDAPCQMDHLCVAIAPERKHQSLIVRLRVVSTIITNSSQIAASVCLLFAWLLLF